MRVVEMRSVRVLVLAVLTLAAAAAPASAVTLQRPDGPLGPQPYQSWADRALVPTPPGLVTLHLAPCPTAASAAGCVLRGRPEVFLAPGAQDRKTLLHELGHVFDQSVLTDPLRRTFQSVLRRPGVWAGAASVDPAEERFAEAYALCAQRRRLSQVHFGMYDYTSTPRQHARTCALIRRAAAAPTR